jgi:hypothetical protein
VIISSIAFEIESTDTVSTSNAIEDIITQLHNHEVPNRKFVPDSSSDMNNLKVIMGGDAPKFERSIRKLKKRLFHLEKWDELHPKYIFRSLDSTKDKIEEYSISFKKGPELLMYIDTYEKGIASGSTVNHNSHIINLSKQPSAFKKHLSKAFNLIGVAVLVELLFL